MRFDRQEIEAELLQARENAEEAQIWWEGRVQELQGELVELDKFEAYLAAWHAKQPHIHLHPNIRIEAIGKPLTDGGYTLERRS